MTQKATREGVREHNRRLILRSVFSGTATNRAAIAQQTGLAKPTVSDLVSELIDEGLLEEGGRGESTESGGKRPTLLNFRTGARQIIGVSIDGLQVQGVLADLSGQVFARHCADLEEVQGKAAITVLQEVINGLIAQLDAPLMCISVGAPGIIQNDVVKSSPTLGWSNLHLADYLPYDVPIYVGNNTELATRAQAAFNTEGARNLVMVLVNASIEIGIAFGTAAYHHSGDLGSLRVLPDVESFNRHVGWRAVKQRIEALRTSTPDTTLPTKPTFLDIYYGYQRGDWVSNLLMDELAGHLAQIFAWITALIRPNHVGLAGGVVELGEPFLEIVTRRAAELIPPDLLNAVTFSLAEDQTLSVTGTVAHALSRELGVL